MSINQLPQVFTVAHVPLSDGSIGYDVRANDDTGNSVCVYVAVDEADALATVAKLNKAIDRGVTLLDYLDYLESEPEPAAGGIHLLDEIDSILPDQL